MENLFFTFWIIVCIIIAVIAIAEQWKRLKKQSTGMGVQCTIFIISMDAENWR